MIEKLTAYNVWANQRIIDYVLAAGNETADKELQSSFNTLRKTLYHIWDAQVIWYSRLQGLSFNSWPGKDFKGSLQEGCIGLIQSSELFSSFAKKVPDFSNPIIYTTLDGKEFSNSMEEIITHCMNHSTYHRGQIITMLRQAGYSAVGSTDFIRYLRERV